MKLKDFFGKVNENVSNKQFAINFRKKEAKRCGIDIDELLETEIIFKKTKEIIK